jgi:hypothetical protein
MELTGPALYFGEYGWPEMGLQGVSSRSSAPQSRQMASGGSVPASVGMMAPGGGGGGETQARLGHPDFVLTNTSSPEIDYPAGGENEITVYDGEAGVPIGSFLRKLLFAIRFKDPVLLLSSEITADSKLLMNRHILQRAHRIFPFIAYDTDPYIFVSDDGGLEWILDSYTYTQRYPYSASNDLQPFVRANYARNAVKVVVDAYDGTVDFYRVDPDDPIAKVFDKIFPGVFKPASEMPDDVVRHLRYPRDAFLWQASALQLYHMTEPGIFYQQEDKWERPQEVFGSRQEDAAGGPAPNQTTGSVAGPSSSSEWERQFMQPYFVLLPPEGETEVDFMQIMPLTRYRRPNMASWLSAYWDTDAGKGRMNLYVFGKESSVYGPMQIEARIDKDPDISEALTLWSGHGSQVIRGNLLAIPIEKTILWVEPIYIQAATEAIPTLQRVVVVFGSKVGGALEKETGVVMADTFEEALELAFGKLEAIGDDDAIPAEPPEVIVEPVEEQPIVEPTPPEEPAETDEPDQPADEPAEPDQPDEARALLQELGRLLDQRNQDLEQEMETNRELQSVIEKMAE